MKKILYIAIFILGIVCVSSCRSTTKSCGLADNTNLIENNLDKA